MGEEILTIRSSADYLHIAEKTAYRMAQGGELPALKARRQWWFKRADIDMWIEPKKMSRTAASEATPPPGRSHCRRGRVGTGEEGRQ